MAARHVLFFSVPGLRAGDVTKEHTPTLYEWANAGALGEMTPTFPCVTSPVQATMWTGRPPAEHGVIANGFYYRDRKEVEFWVARNDAVAGEQIWTALRRRGLTSAVWHAQNIKDADADFIVTPAPIHEPDGTTKLWCYSKPDGLYQQLLDDLGHFPLQHYWGPLSNIESTKWILRSALWLIKHYNPNLHWIYIPHLDYASQKHGPESPQAQAALIELDTELARFQESLRSLGADATATKLVVGEYAMTDVSRVVYPNRILREAGLLAVRESDGSELIDFDSSRAFAMVDHQFAHVYCTDAQATAQCEALFRNVAGVQGCFASARRRDIGMDHERSGEVILVTEPDAWLAYYWWQSDAAAPPFARTVDIHQKPGFDPVELFFEPATKSIPLDAGLVKGSHGAPAVEARQRAAILCSKASAKFGGGATCVDRDITEILLCML